MKCKLNRECHRKTCTKRKSGCPYDCGPNDIPLTLSEGHVKRRLDALRERWRVIAENQTSYVSGEKAVRRSRIGSRLSEIGWGDGHTSDERRAYWLGVREALTRRDEADADYAHRARWERGAIRRGELDESDREYSRRPL